MYVCEGEGKNRGKIPITLCCGIFVFIFLFSSQVFVALFRTYNTFSLKWNATLRMRWWGEIEWECEVKTKWLKSPTANTFLFLLPHCGTRTIDDCVSLPPPSPLLLNKAVINTKRQPNSQSHTHSLFASIHARQQNHNFVVVDDGVGCGWWSFSSFRLTLFLLLFSALRSSSHSSCRVLMICDMSVFADIVIAKKQQQVIGGNWMSSRCHSPNNEHTLFL